MIGREEILEVSDEPASNRGSAGSLSRVEQTVHDLLARYERAAALTADDQVGELMQKLADLKRRQRAMLSGGRGNGDHGPAIKSAPPTDGDGPGTAMPAGSLAMTLESAFCFAVWAETHLWTICFEVFLMCQRQAKTVATELVRGQKQLLEGLDEVARQMGMSGAYYLPGACRKSGTHEGGRMATTGPASTMCDMKKFQEHSV